jgi:hypothetical protein
MTPAANPTSSGPVDCSAQCVAAKWTAETAWSAWHDTRHGTPESRNAWYALERAVRAEDDARRSCPRRIGHSRVLSASGAGERT